MNKEKVYISRDHGDDKIYVWRKPKKGNWSPTQLKDCDVVNWQREDMENVDIYLVSDFKKKFGFTIRQKTKNCVRLPSNLVHTDTYQCLY